MSGLPPPRHSNVIVCDAAWRSGVLKVPQVVFKCRKVWEPLRWEVQCCNLKIDREGGIGSKIFIWGKENTYLFFFLPYFLWLTKAWMKPESENYVLEARITPKVLGRNHVRFSDLDVCSGGSLIKHLRWFWCRLMCRSKFEKFVGVASCTDWQNQNQIVKISLAHKIVSVEKAGEWRSARFSEKSRVITFSIFF